MVLLLLPPECHGASDCQGFPDPVDKIARPMHSAAVPGSSIDVPSDVGQQLKRKVKLLSLRQMRFVCVCCCVEARRLVTLRSFESMQQRADSATSR